MAVNVSISRNRISLRAVAAGILLSVPMMIFFSSAARDYFLEYCHVSGASDSDVLLVWLVMSAIWSLCVAGGAFISSRIAQLSDRMSGALSGLLVWSGSYFILGVLIAVRASGMEPILEFEDARSIMWVRDVMGEFTALLLGGLGGAAGVYGYEAKDVLLKLENQGEGDRDGVEVAGKNDEPAILIKTPLNLTHS